MRYIRRRLIENKNCSIPIQYTEIMSELLYEESVFDDSSDLEESWAGENVTFDTSPTSRK